jgi:hypothetical protein
MHGIPNLVTFVYIQFLIAQFISAQNSIAYNLNFVFKFCTKFCTNNPTEEKGLPDLRRLGLS